MKRRGDDTKFVAKVFPCIYKLLYDTSLLFSLLVAHGDFIVSYFPVHFSPWVFLFLLHGFPQ